MRLVIRAAFDTFSGYGRDGVDLARFLQKAGADVHLWPTSIMAGLPPDFVQLLTKNPVGEKDALLTFCDPISMRPWEWGDVLPPKVLGYSMWERTPLLPTDFPDQPARLELEPPREGENLPQLVGVEEEGSWYGHELGWSPHGVHGMAVTCDMNRDAFAAIDPALPPEVIPCGVDTEKWKPVKRDRSAPIRFLIVGQLSNRRKNLWALLETWRELQKDPAFRASGATLTVHAMGPGIHPGVADAFGPNLVVSLKALSDQGLADLYAAHDVYVAPSRGEGNNKPPMEFMATGGTVIATDWSGHQNWLHRDVTWSVGGELVECPDAPGSEEFEVDRAQLAAAMVDAVEHPAVVRAKQANAPGFIGSALGWPKVAARMLRWIEQVPTP